MAEDKPVTVESLPELLKNDVAVKVAGIDVDGMLRGKLMAKKKFLSIAKDGFGFCSIVFGWDMHDQTYFKELGVSNKENGYRDLIAIPDLSSFRRIPWENNVPFFLVSFHDPDTHKTLHTCPRSLLKRAVDKLKENGYGAMAGAEYEFYQFRAPQTHDGPERNSSGTATFLKENPVNALPSLTEGMFGYSITRTVHNQDYFYEIFHACEEFNCGIEGWHTESGPGVFEAVSHALAAILRQNADNMTGSAVRRNQRHGRQSLPLQTRRQVHRLQIRHNTLLHGEAARRPPRKQRTYARFHR